MQKQPYSETKTSHFTKCSNLQKHRLQSRPSQIEDDTSSLIQAVALTVNNEPVFAFLGRPNVDDLYCPSCKCQVYFRSAHKRKSHKEAEPDTCVRAHFVHYLTKEADGSTSSCHNRESQIHIYGKEIVCAMIECIKPMVPSCILCNHAIDIQVIPPKPPTSPTSPKSPNQNNNGISNYKVVCEYTFSNFRADVAVIVDGLMWCCIEVFNTSKISSQKIDYLNLHEIPWIEVSALALVEAFEAKNTFNNSEHSDHSHQQLLSSSYYSTRASLLSIPVVNCSNHGLCAACIATTPFKTREQAQASLPWFKSMCSILVDHMSSRVRCLSLIREHREEIKQIALQVQSQDDILAYLKARLVRSNETLDIAKKIVTAEKELNTMEIEIDAIKRNLVDAQHVSRESKSHDDILAYMKARLAHCSVTLDIAKRISTMEKEIKNIKRNNQAIKDLATDEELQEYLAMVSKKHQDLVSLEWQCRNSACENKTELPFGKHKGHCLEAVWAHDPGYVVWLAGFLPRLSGSRPETHTNNTNFPANVKQLAKTLIQGTCYACYESLVDVEEKWKTFCGSCYRELKNY